MPGAEPKLGLTNHSSRTRFAGRLNSGVRPYSKGDESVNERQKLAALLFRLGGAALLFRVVGGIALLFAAPGASLIARQYPTHIVFGSSLIWLVLSLVLFFGAVPLGKFFGRGLD